MLKTTPLLELDNIECRYEEQTIFHNLSLSIQAGELACLLGASGCGKTTALRAIAGFEPIYNGTIRLNGNNISEPNQILSPEKRQIGMVFQDYALFPHQTVFDNVAFGLRALNKTEKKHRVEEYLNIVGLAHLSKRYPHELSGGQQQRVALARALAPRPALILLDEPFSNLDVDLRERLSLEVRDILKGQGMTGLLVTHDQHEAFALGDKIGVMRHGKILQWDSAYKLYHEPTERYIADFIGKGSFIKGQIMTKNQIETELGVVKSIPSAQSEIGNTVDVLVRPDDILLDPDCHLLATVKQKAFKGSETLYTLSLPSGTQVFSLFSSHHDYPVGAQVGIRVVAEQLVTFPPT
ncbi:ABC transporter ATP-binding protein [Beggiatoa leptomitoformis]|uniref:ATP-binding cassette domain-containing protein n=1 Tax=Beggiatoa leptomitoformis TaxID=288004 RepID=A0A2N9YFD6_9GAMM|nr:ABC transporter ATP-binding protein [Beggiatoa leptomitoformis]ALG68484.1 ATP-binding cassette domain-containing protein [Beggiatoa leptomitoformis]AUI69180.1 ATP-binding cassette domain-containing protein [Beggiatoa leptomitoformis]